MSKFRRITGWVHLWTGLIAAPLLFVLGLTGSFLIFEYPLDRLLHARLAYVQPGPDRKPLDTLLASIHSAYPAAKVLTFALSPDSPAPDIAYTALIQLPQHSDTSTVFVNQYTGQVLGNIDGKSFATTVHEFHTDMLLGDRGAFIMMLIASLLILLSLSGIVLWWPRKIVSIRWSASGRRINFDLHNAIGFYSFVFLLLFGVTGVVVHWQSKWLPMANNALHLPDTEPELKIAASGPGARAILLEAAAATARRSLPAARLTQINMPGAGGVYRIWLKYPEDGTPLGRSFVLVNAYSGTLLYTRSARTVGLPTRFFREWNREVHTGDILGWPTRLLACLMSLMLPVLAITGPLFWLRRPRVVPTPNGPQRRRA
ncbi:MAG TPA: PepSY-associated TM helix domain-containing protein [Terracidiphilus sp.]|nr:PepSY-associated TM helix domain-containing protein [Terracidiphilus sp.]